MNVKRGLQQSFYILSYSSCSLVLFQKLLKHEKVDIHQESLLPFENFKQLI